MDKRSAVGLKNKRKQAVIYLSVFFLLIIGLFIFNYFTHVSDFVSDEEFLLLTIGTADSGGTMYPVGSAIAEILSTSNSKLKVNISASSGSVANVISLQHRQIDLGLVSGDVAFHAYMGLDEFQDNPTKDLRAIGAVYSSMSNWIVSESSQIQYVYELKGKRLGLGPLDSSTDLSARSALEVLGIDTTNSILENHGIGSGSIAVKNETLDSVHGFAGVPISALEDLSQQIPTRLLKYTDEELADILIENPSYSRMTIPAGTYTGQTEDVATFGVKCLLSVDASMDDELVYLITGILVEVIPELTVSNELMAEMAQSEFLCHGLPIPLHDGAQRYYEENGFIETSDVT